MLDHCLIVAFLYSLLKVLGQYRNYYFEQKYYLGLYRETIERLLKYTY